MPSISPSRSSPYSSTKKSPARDKNRSNNNSNDDDASSNSSSDGEISSKFSHLREVVKAHPRVRQAKKSLRLVKKMEQITKSDRYRELMKEGFEVPPSSSDDDDDVDGDNDNNKKKANDEKNSTRTIMESTDDPKIKNALLMAASLEQLNIDPRSSAFSSDKLCAEFLQAARLAGAIQVWTDDMVEIVLEEVTPYWTNPDIYPIVRDALEASEELERHCREDLQQSAIRFCGAADRVIRGAREEVRSMLEDIASVQAVNERYVARIEDVKSKILSERQRVADLTLAISARRLCLLENGQEFSRIFSEETREALMHEVGTQDVFGHGHPAVEEAAGGAVVGNDDLFEEEEESNNKKKPTTKLMRKGSSNLNGAGHHHQYRQSIRSRLRMLLSASIMQVKGQKTADERVLLANSSTMNAGGKYAASSQSPVGSSRILQALETILTNL